MVFAFAGILYAAVLAVSYFVLKRTKMLSERLLLAAVNLVLLVLVILLFRDLPFVLQNPGGVERSDLTAYYVEGSRRRSIPQWVLIDAEGNEYVAPMASPLDGFGRLRPGEIVRLTYLPAFGLVLKLERRAGNVPFALLPDALGRLEPDSYVSVYSLEEGLVSFLILLIVAAPIAILFYGIKKQIFGKEE